jgi:signal peptidase I
MPFVHARRSPLLRFHASIGLLRCRAACVAGARVNTVTSSEPSVAEAPSEARGRVGNAGSARQIFESIVCLAIAVILFRAFEVEGYMISTGSMAPTLLGYHKRIDCPNCGYQFACGVAVDETNSRALSSIQRAGASPDDEPIDAAPPTDESHGQVPSRAEGRTATCPNCGYDVRDLDAIPLNQGDQLLVHKNAFAFHEPRRWDVAVFQNPSRPTQAYVKRIVGLPGERFEIRDGDVFVDGKICRKGLELQRALRIGVYDNDFRPVDDSEWRSRWVAEADPSPWKASGGEFHNSSTFKQGGSADEDFAWVEYRHWTRRGSRGRTFVPLEPREGQILIPDLKGTPVDFDAGDGTLACTGVLSKTWRDRLMADSHDVAFQHALEKLFEKSHLAPVGDSYGYNDSENSNWETPVRDLMISLELEHDVRSGQFAVELSDGRQTFRLVLEFLRREIELDIDGSTVPARRGTWSPQFDRAPLVLEMSIFDRQVLAAVNGEEPFAAWPIEENDKSSGVPESPVKFGARRGAFRVKHLQLFRDVYYTHKGNQEQFALGPDEFFVLGDNSPVSFDSRSWQNPAVDRGMLIGKPLFLHLPSRPGRLKMGNKEYHIRIPDFSRIRYIR